MPKEILERKGVIAQHQIADGKGVPKDVRADALVGDPGSLANARKEERHPVDRQWQARFRKEEMILSTAAPFREFLFIWTVPLKIVEELAQTVLSKCNAPLFGAFALYNDEAMFAVKVACA